MKHENGHKSEMAIVSETSQALPWDEKKDYYNMACSYSYAFILKFNFGENLIVCNVYKHIFIHAQGRS